MTSACFKSVVDMYIFPKGEIQKERASTTTWGFPEHCFPHEVLEPLSIKARPVNRNSILQKWNKMIIAC